LRTTGLRLLSNCNGRSNSAVRNTVVPRQKNLKPRNCGRRRRLNRPHRPKRNEGFALAPLLTGCPTPVRVEKAPPLPAGGRGLRPYQLSLAESSVLPHQSKSGNAGDGSQCLDTKESPAEAGPVVELERHLTVQCKSLHSLALADIDRRTIAQTLAEIEAGSGLVDIFCVGHPRGLD